MSSKSTVYCICEGHIYTEPNFDSGSEKEMLCIDTNDCGGMDGFDCLEVLADSHMGLFLLNAIELYNNKLTDPDNRGLTEKEMRMHRDEVNKNKTYSIIATGKATLTETNKPINCNKTSKGYIG